MWRTIRTWLAALALFLALTPVALAPPAGEQKAKQAPTSQPVGERGQPVPQYALALLTIMLVLVVVCMPSRKR